jgi:hypothetical protein
LSLIEVFAFVVTTIFNQDGYGLGFSSVIISILSKILVSFVLNKIQGKEGDELNNRVRIKSTKDNSISCARCQ